MSEEAAYKAEEAGKLRPRSSLPALLVIVTGVALLVANVLHLHLIELFWPGFVITPGLLLLWPAYNATAERQTPFSFLAVFGAMTVTVGLLLFVMNLTNHFEAWAYSWTLVLASAAAGLMYVKRFDETSGVHETGRKLIRLMAILFMGLAVFFEIIVFENFSPLLPLVLIAYGLYLLFRDRRLAAS